MASSSKQAPRGAGILSPDYMALLQSLCTLNQPTVNDITAIFHSEFRRALGGGRARPSVRAEAASAQAPSTSRGAPSTSRGAPSTSRGAPSTSRGAPSTSRGSKKRGGKSVRGKGRGRKGGGGDDPDDDGEEGGDDTIGDEDGFQRTCTWEPDKPCWLFGEMEEWNRQLAKCCFELRVHKWSEFSLTGFAWPDNNAPDYPDVLRLSLLTHLLLRQHRCVTRVVVDMTTCTLEHKMFWHALQNGAGGVKCIEYQGTIAEQHGIALRPECVRWAHSVSGMSSLCALYLSSVYFDAEISEALAKYVQETTTLVTLSFQNMNAQTEDAAATFLEALALNKTLRTFYIPPDFVMARDGAPISKFLRNHPTIDKIVAYGSETASPTGLLEGAMRSASLRSLHVKTCTINPEDLQELGFALTRRPPSPATEEGTTSTQTSRLENLTFTSCPVTCLIMEHAYASLIGGVLLSLTLSNCALRETFSSAAAVKLRTDTRLRKLDIQHNEIGLVGHRTLVRVLEINQSLELLAFSMRAVVPAPHMTVFCNVIRELKVSARLSINWVNPRGPDFAEAVDLAKITSAYMDLDDRSLADATPLLDAVASSRSIQSATIECSNLTLEPVLQKLAAAIGSTSHLRDLKLCIRLPEVYAVNLLRSLENNRTIRILEITNFVFRKRAIKALGRMVEENRVINMLTIIILEGKDCFNEMRAVCRELKEAILRNRFLIGVAVQMIRDNHASDFVIKDALRRNMLYVHEAIRFINGSNEKSHALAFETLQYSQSLKMVLALNLSTSEEEAAEKIDEARERLAANYFRLTGVVRDKITCKRDRRKRATLDDLTVDLLARICSYLSLTDVMDL
ncbi:uncharacterized protein LOC142592773 [Dermacentor variabilis]|uniref:uncharacterized protein LOC142592773 n=1 Tax=Dermacentor variabilis TaxID=34621 RepID=UPI003F5C396B